MAALPRTAFASTQEITLYLHPHSGVSSSGHAAAQEGAFSLRNQLNDYTRNFELSVSVQDGWSGDDSRDELESDWESIPSDVDPSEGDGIHHFLVSDIVDTSDIGASDHGYGHRIEDVTPEHSGACVTNVGALQMFDGDAETKNLVIHEYLHAFDVGHALGSVDIREGIFFERYTNITPMATAYVDALTPDTRFQGTGSMPGEFCEEEDNGKNIRSTSHTDEISFCSIQRAVGYLNDVYDTGGGGGCTDPCITSESEYENKTDALAAPRGQIHDCY